MRTVIFDGYDTASHVWTLSGLALGTPDVVTNYVDVPGRLRGPLDLSTALTDGQPVYSGRALTVTLECSAGSRLGRETMINDLVNRLHGRRVERIILPDDAAHYLSGRLAVTKKFSDPAHCRVVITGELEPWRYSVNESTTTRTASSQNKTATVINGGSLPVAPTLTTTGTIRISNSSHSVELTPGTYELPWLQLRPGSTSFTYTGTGSLTLTWREGVL